MKLTLRERFGVLAILPDRGNFDTLKIVHDLKMALAPDEKVWKEREIKNDGGMVTWNPNKKDVKYEVEIGPVAKKIIVDALIELDKQERLDFQTASLYQRFVLGEDEESGPKA